MVLLLKLGLGTFHNPKAEMKDLPYVIINLEWGSCMRRLAGNMITADKSVCNTHSGTG